MAGGGYTTVDGIWDQVEAEGNPQVQRDQTVYNPRTDENPQTSSTGLAAFGETIGTASGYRTPGYAVGREYGLVGQSAANSIGEQQGWGNRALDARYAGGQFRDDYRAGLGMGLDARGQQMTGLGMTGEAAQMYRAMAMGQGPSLARLQLQQGLQQAQAQQASIAAGARGGGANLAAAQLAGATMAGQQAAGANQQAAMIRAQEQMAAMQGLGAMGAQYGGMAGAMRGQDYGAAGMGLQGYGQSQQMAQAYEEMRQKQQLAELGAQTELEKQQGELALQKQKQNAQENQESAKEGSKLFGGLLGALGL